MSVPRGWKQGLARVSRLWDRREYASALAAVDALLADWPGSAHLRVLRARLIQLQDDGGPPLSEVTADLRRAAELDPDAPAPHTELGYFLDAVKDDPAAAATAFAGGVSVARRALVDGLIGQAKALRQLDRMDEFRRCVTELLHLTGYDAALPPRLAEELKELLGDLAVARSA